jgi:(p)ppGpp synthase/HD superfamily hydrolase
MSSLEKAIQIAEQAHEGQRDKAGAPYILHPLRVMMKMATEAEQIIAVLHDVVEDTDWTMEQLQQEGYNREILDALDCLARRDGEEYGDFIKRVKQNPLSVKVKVADLEDNLDVSRLKGVTDTDAKRLEKYQQALKMLSNLH